MIEKFIYCWKNNLAVEVLEYLLKYYKDCKLGVVCNKTETGEKGMKKLFWWLAQQWNVREYVMNIELFMFEHEVIDKCV